MLKKISLVLYLILFSSHAYSAGSDSTPKKVNSDYDKAVESIKFAKKHEKKGKIEKAKKRYEKALSYLIKSNEKKPNQPDTLNYLGFALRKLGEFKEAEKYYLQGLNIKPDHNGINEYLGELYIQTDRLDIAKGRLEVLKNCKCEEYEELKELIENN